MARRLNGDLVTLATVAQAYGRGEGSQNLYSLAQYGHQIALVMSPGDVEAGLSLVGVESFRLTAAGQDLPRMVPFAISEGHIVLAQVRGEFPCAKTVWVLLTSADQQRWAGIATGWDFIAHGISSQLRWILTGHYVICAEPLPDWEADPLT